MTGKLAFVMAAGLALAVLTLAFGLYPRILVAGLQFDDSFITFRYARNLATGHGLAFNPGEAVNSASSLLYTLVLAACYWLGLHDLPAVAAAIGLLAAVATVGLLVVVARQLGLSPLAALAVIVPFAISGHFVGWAVSGMETNVYTFLVVAFAAAIIAGAHGAMLAIVPALILTRPEGITLIAAFAAAIVIAPAGPGLPAMRLRWTVVAAGVATFGGYLLLNAVICGDPLPYAGVFKMLTLYYNRPLRAKLVLFKEQIAGPFAPILMLAATFGAHTCWRWLRRHPTELWRIFLAIALAGSIAMYVLGPIEDLGRYYQPVTALMAIAAAALLVDLRDILAPPGWAKAAALVGIGVIGIWLAADDQLRTAAIMEEGAAHQEARLAIGRFIDRNVDRAASVISSDVGAIAYAAPNHRIIDVFGLTTRWTQEALRAGDVARLQAMLRAREPLIIADSVYRGDAIRAIDILQAPQRFYHGAAQPDGSIAMLIVGRELYRSGDDDGLRFAVYAGELAPHRDRADGRSPEPRQ